jgi:outer membrane protein TolC
LVALVCGPGGAAPRGARAQAQQVLRIEDAVHLALTRNERARIADSQVIVAEAGVERARAGFLPVLSVSANETLREETSRDGVVTTPGSAGTATVTFTQPLINLSVWPLYGQARQLLDAQRASSQDDKRTLGYDAARAFLGVLQSDAVVKAADRRLDAAKANLANTQARAQAGLTSSNDVTRAEIDLASAEREVQLDRGTVENLTISLAFVLNAQIGGPLAAPKELLVTAEKALPGTEELVRGALGRRPDVVSERHTLQAAHDFATEPLLRLAPTLSVSGQASATTFSSSGKTYDELATFKLSWTLYDASVRYADRHSRDAQAVIAQLNLEALERNVGAQVRSAVALLASSQSALKVAEDAMNASRLSLDETAILYKQGLAKALELVDATDQRFIAEVNYAAAQYSLVQAYLNLRQAAGVEVLQGELP